MQQSHLRLSARARQLAPLLAIFVVLTLITPAMIAGQARRAEAQVIGQKSETRSQKLTEADYVPGEVLVKFKPSAAIAIDDGKPEVASLDLAQTLNCFTLMSARHVIPGT